MNATICTINDNNVRKSTYKGKNLEVRLQRGKESFTTKERPYIKHWIFLSITPESLNDVSNKELKNIIHK
mgnify:CR=1 FL=1